MPILKRVIAVRRPLSLAVVMLAIAAALAGCGESEGSASESTLGPNEYPIVEEPPIARQPTTTTASGAVGSLPVLPTVYVTKPSPTCERSYVTFHDGSEPAYRPVVVPPKPGLRAIAVTEHTTRLEWSFVELPDDCRPIELGLAVTNGSSIHASPTTKRVDVDGETGSVEIVYPDGRSAPNVAYATSYARDGFSSRLARVLIERPVDTPPDPPDPIPPVTALAGRPVTCQARPTIVNEPAGDVIKHEASKPPKPVRHPPPRFSGLDITRAAVQFDERTVCATITFARVPEEAFELSFQLADVSEPLCCATLLFRNTRGRLEVGHYFIDSNGGGRLVQVPDGGASLRGATLTITGTLPPPSEWTSRGRRMPESENLAWRVGALHVTAKDGSYLGDWLPRHESLNQPAIRHSDGAIMRPGR